MSPAVSAADAIKQIRSGKASRGLQVSGSLDLSRQKFPANPSLPAGLTTEVLNLTGQSALKQLPEEVKLYELVAAETGLETLPEDLEVTFRIDLSRCDRLSSLPSGLKAGSLLLRGCSELKALPEDLDVWFLDMTGCWAFEEWPERAHIHSGRLLLRGCTALRHLPDYLQNLAAVDVRDCPNLRSLPEGLRISGWLDIGHSGLDDESCLPASLNDVQLRWAGVNVDRRIAFHPELITAAEVLAERNAERRRVLMDRMGYRRFLLEADAKVINTDRDPGGERQLLRVELEGDEALVSLSCFCPSTGRQYIIRVPPQTVTCHQAAAWIAGYDNPKDYRPLIET